MDPLKLQLQRRLAQLDQQLHDQLHVLLHHPQLQTLEARWRGLFSLINAAPAQTNNINIKILSLSWPSLLRDFSRAADIAQTVLFQKLHAHEFDQAGSEPFSVLLGDYALSSHPIDMAALENIIQLMSQLFLPFFTSLSPHFFGLTHFSAFHKLHLSRCFQTARHLPWKKLREKEESYFLGLCLSRILLRAAHTAKPALSYYPKPHQKEEALWGNAIYLLGSHLINTFLKTHWFLQIFDDDAVTSLTRDTFSDGTPKYLTEFQPNTDTAMQLFHHGFSAIKDNSRKNYLAFHALPTAYAQTTKILFNHMLCLSRFAHYIKKIARDKIGLFQHPKACEQYLQDWLHQYTADNPDIHLETKVKYPLKKSRVRVNYLPGNIKKFHCEIELVLHTEKTDIQFKLTTQLKK